MVQHFQYLIKFFFVVDDEMSARFSKSPQYLPKRTFSQYIYYLITISDVVITNGFIIISNVDNKIYSLFVIDAMAGIAQILSTPQDNLWTYQTPDGRGMAKGLEFIFPYIADKSKWPYKHDVLYWDEWPFRQPCLVFGGVALNMPEYLEVWKKLRADSDVDEVKRNVPLRHPLLWVGPMRPVAQISKSAVSPASQPATVITPP